MTPSKSSGPAKGISNTKNHRSSYQAPPNPRCPALSSSTETITLTLAEYAGQLHAQFEAGKQEGIRSQQEKYQYLEEDMKKLVSVTQNMTNELLAEGRKEWECQQNLRINFDAGKEEGMRLQRAKYMEHGNLEDDMKELVEETKKMKVEVLEEIRRQGGNVEDVLQGERMEKIKDFAREGLKGRGIKVEGGEQKFAFRQ